jgi:hypothetical protein
MNLDQELLGECAQALEVTGLRLTTEQVRDLLSSNHALAGELSEWGPRDTETLAQLVDHLTTQLLSESWPTFGEERSGRDTASFNQRFLAAARGAGYVVLQDVSS